MPKPVNHILHIILSIITGGLWLFVYVPILIRAGRRNKAYVAALNREQKRERDALRKAERDTVIWGMSTEQPLYPPERYNKEARS